MSDDRMWVGDRYRLERVLGEGALGRTWLADDTAAGRQVAIKELLPARMKTVRDFDLFERECQMLRSLSHPGVPRYFDHLEQRDTDGTPRLLLVQEFIDGHVLQEEIAEQALSEVDVIAIADEVLEVLVYLHGLSPAVIHRDIKPENIMRRSDGSLALIDFGAVREVLDASTEGSTMVGTFGYMPPEQYAGRAMPQTDLFALGATCVHLLTRRPPEELFGALFHIEIPDVLPLSVGMRRWLDRMIDPDPARRFPSAAVALRVLRSGFLFGVPQQALAKLPPDPGPPPRPRPGLHLRDPVSGQSMVGLLFAVSFGALLIFPALILSASQGSIGGVVLSASLLTFTLGAIVGKAWLLRVPFQRFRRGEYAVGEVIGVYGDGGVHYRFQADGVIHGGHLLTRASYLKQLRAHDPIAVLYDADDPSCNTPFIG